IPSRASFEPLDHPDFLSVLLSIDRHEGYVFFHVHWTLLTSLLTSSLLSSFVIETTTPESPLISTLSINASIKNRPNPPSFSCSNDVSALTGAFFSFIAFTSKLRP